MWWGRRPRHCLKIGPEALVWAQAGRGWTGRRDDRCVIRPLDPGSIRPSPAEPNVVRLASVQEQVRSLVGPPKRLRIAGQSVAPPMPLPIVLLLPDICVRTAVFELDRIPRRREERDALVRWRFGQDHFFPLAGAKVCYQLLPEFGPKDAVRRTSVLAAAIHESVLEQYEALCAASNLVPVEITTSTFQLCNLWLESRASQPRGGTGNGVLWMSLLDRTFSVLAFRHGRVVFTRAKLLPAADRAEETEGMTSDHVSWIVREALVSLQVWQDTSPEAVTPQVALVVDEAEPTLVQRLREALRSEVNPIDWTLFRRHGWPKRMQELPLNAMPAVAGLC